MYLRQATALLAAKLHKPYVHVLFGAHQTGKSTLLRALLPRPALWLDLANPGERSRYLIRPETLVQECRALPSTGEPSQVVIDEVQAVPPHLRCGPASLRQR